MRLKHLFFISPIILAIEFMLFSTMTEMLRQQSDISVLFGVLTASIILFGNYLLFKIIIKLSNKPKKTNK